MKCLGSHEMVAVQSTYNVAHNTECVVNWCRKCGAIRKDLVHPNGKMEVGYFMPTREPENQS